MRDNSNKQFNTIKTELTLFTSFDTSIYRLVVSIGWNSVEAALFNGGSDLEFGSWDAFPMNNGTGRINDPIPTLDLSGTLALKLILFS